MEELNKIIFFIPYNEKKYALYHDQGEPYAVVFSHTDFLQSLKGLSQLHSSNEEDLPHYHTHLCNYVSENGAEIVLDRFFLEHLELLHKHPEPHEHHPLYHSIQNDIEKYMAPSFEDVLRNQGMLVPAQEITDIDSLLTLEGLKLLPDNQLIDDSTYHLSLNDDKEICLTIEIFDQISASSIQEIETFLRCDGFLIHESPDPQSTTSLTWNLGPQRPFPQEF